MFLNQRVCDAGSFVQELGQLQKKHERRMWMIVGTKPTKNHDLMKLLLESDSPQEIDKTILNYWKKFWGDKEPERYCILNCIRREDQTIEHDQDKVNEQLLLKMQEIQIDHHWKLIKGKGIPKTTKNQSGIYGKNNW